MNKLQVNLFCMKEKLNRFPLTKCMVEQLLVLNRDNIKLMIHGEQPNISLWQEFFNNYHGKTQVDFHVCPDGNYCRKVRYSHLTECKYSCKLDDDVLISQYVWGFILDNLHELDDRFKTPLVAPILTNGMSSVELFMRDFLDEKQRFELESILLNSKVDERIWGLDFSGINSKIKSMKTWDGYEYWNFVEKYDNKFREKHKPETWKHVLGVHPSRFSYDFNMSIAKMVISNKDKFYSKHDYSFEKYPTPYFTNNMFVTTTDYWKETFNMFYDGWDEGQLTIKMKKDGNGPAYIKNGFGIHMAYGCTDRQIEIENFYTSML